MWMDLQSILNYAIKRFTPKCFLTLETEVQTEIYMTKYLMYIYSLYNQKLIQYEGHLNFLIIAHA